MQGGAGDGEREAGRRRWTTDGRGGRGTAHRAWELEQSCHLTRMDGCLVHCVGGPAVEPGKLGSGRGRETREHPSAQPKQLEQINEAQQRQPVASICASAWMAGWVGWRELHVPDDPSHEYGLGQASLGLWSFRSSQSLRAQSSYALSLAMQAASGGFMQAIYGCRRQAALGLNARQLFRTFDPQVPVGIPWQFYTFRYIVLTLQRSFSGP